MGNSNTISPRTILLVDDDGLEARIIKRLLQELAVACPLLHFADGEEALAYLKRPGGALPCVIFLDLILQGMNGIEFLREIRATPELHDLPIVVVTISNEDEERRICEDLGVAGFVVKCLDYDEFKRNIRAFEQYWQLERRAV